MELACLDLEGVLIPEIWIEFADRTGIPELRATTRDVPDYDVLMKQRLRLLDQHGLKLPDIQAVAAPLMRQLGNPTLFCHRLEADAAGRVTDYVLRQKDPKRQAVKALKSLNFRVIAAGDSYNDTTMLAEADAGILFNAPERVIAEVPQFPSVVGYPRLREAFRAASIRDL